MSNASRVLFDAPGPSGRRRIMIGTVITCVLIAVLLGAAIAQFAQAGELAYAKWKPFWQQWAVKYFLDGLRGTLIVTAVAALFSFPIGALLALGRISTTKILRYPCVFYIEVFRSVPTLLLIYVFLFALPGLGVNLSIFAKLTVPIVLVNCAVIAELVRAGVNALDRGQSEAAYAVGMTRGLAMRSVVLPQAVRLVIPALVTQLVALLKDSTLGYVVSYPELMKQAQSLANNTKLLLQAFLVVSAIYIVINFLLTRLAVWLESRLGRAATNKKSDGPADGDQEPGSAQAPEKTATALASPI